MTAQSALLGRGLSVRIGGRVVLDGVDLEVGPGELLGVVGSNGCGKTTLLRVCAGLVRPDSGEVTVSGSSPREVRTRFGFLPQEVELPGGERVGDLLSLFTRLRGLSSRAAGEVLAMLDLTDRRDDPVMTLSGGLRRRVTVAIAMLGSPPLLLLDEPFSNLDPEGSGRLAAVLEEHVERGGSVLVTSPGTAYPFGDRPHLTLEKGRIRRALGV